MGGGNYSKVKGGPEKKNYVQSGDTKGGVQPSHGTAEGEKRVAASKAEYMKRKEYINQNKNVPGPGGRPLGEKGAGEKYDYEKWKKSPAGRGYISK